MALRLLLVAYLPGALIVRLPVADRPKRAALPAEERAFWAVIISATVSSLVGLGLAVAGRYSFERLLLIDGLISAGLLLGVRRRLSYGGAAARLRWALVIPLVLVAGGFLRFFPSSEYVIGGKDPGVYINEGIAIAQRGTLLVDDPVVAALPAEARDMFIPVYPGQAYYSVRFMGFFVLDPARGTVIGQFPHLYPLWVAIGYGLGGLAGGLRMIGWWSILGLLAVYFAGSRLVGRPAAAVASSFLAVSLLQVWYGRYPNTEMMQQPLLFAGLLAFTRAHVDGDRFFGWVAGVVLGVMLFLRVDAALAVVAVAVASILLITQRRPPRASFLVALGLVLAAAGIYLTRLMAPYAARPLGYLANLRPVSLILLGAAAGALVALLAAARNRRVAEAIATWVPRVLAGVVVCAAVYAYFFRQAGGRLAAPDAAAFRTFAWYLPPEALAVAVLGLAMVVWRRFWRDPALLIAVIAFCFFFFYKTQVARDHFWAARRFVAIIFPAALLMLSAAALSAFWPASGGDGGHVAHGRSAKSVIWRVVLPAIFLGVIGWRLVALSRPILDHVEYAGVIPRIEALARMFTADDLVLVEPRYSSDLHVLAPPLAYIYGRNVLLLNTPRPDKAQFREFVEQAQRRYRHVYFIGQGGVDLVSRSFSAEPVIGDRFEVPEYEQRANAYPTGVRFMRFDYTIYRLVPGLSPSPFRSLDIGAQDDVNVLRFHAKQRTDAVPYRWSRDVSYISLANLPASARTLTLWLDAGGRPESVPQARLALYLDDELLGEALVAEGLRPYRFTIPPEVASRAAAKDDPAVLKLTSNTWNPRVALGSGDNRDLGVMVNRVEVQ